jgi:arginine decarboxylase
MRVVEKLRAAGRTDILQAWCTSTWALRSPTSANIKQAMTEVARYYVELRKLGLDVTHVDVGGGLGVDYDGSGRSDARPA